MFSASLGCIKDERGEWTSRKGSVHTWWTQPLLPDLRSDLLRPRSCVEISPTPSWAPQGAGNLAGGGSVGRRGTDTGQGCRSRTELGECNLGAEMPNFNVPVLVITALSWNVLRTRADPLSCVPEPSVLLPLSPQPL